MIKQYHRTYNDGVVRICSDPQARTDFGAKTNIASPDDLTTICRLRFRELSCRQQDLAWAEMEEVNLSRKIVTPMANFIKSSDQALIGTTLYNIARIDFDRPGSEMYLYLTEVRVFDTD